MRQTLFNKRFLFAGYGNIAKVEKYPVLYHSSISMLTITFVLFSKSKNQGKIWPIIAFGCGKILWLLWWVYTNSPMDTPKQPSCPISQTYAAEHPSKFNSPPTWRTPRSHNQATSRPRSRSVKRLEKFWRKSRHYDYPLEPIQEHEPLNSKLA